MKQIESIRDLFVNHQSPGIKYDKRLSMQLDSFGNRFVNKNDDHVKFFGGNLVGVQTVRFTPTEKNDWLIGILDYDESVMRKQLIKLPTVDANWVRGTDIMNLSCLWLVHCFYNSDMAPKDKEIAMLAALKALHYKFLTSILSYYFRYPVNEGLALAVYANLSKKYAIRQLGTWSRVIDERCRDIISSTSIHLRTIEKFDDDGAIQYMVTDIQGRMRNMIKNIKNVFERVRSEDTRLLSTSGMVEIDGVKVIRDLSRDSSAYLRYIGDVVREKNAFVKEELILIIGAEVKTAPDKLIRDVLIAYCDISNGKRPNNYNKSKDPKDHVSTHGVERLNKVVLVHALGVISQDRSLMAKKDYRAMISKLRALYMASRSSDDQVLQIREITEVITSMSINSRNPAIIAAVKTALALYIFIRTMTKDHYS